MNLAYLLLLIPSLHAQRIRLHRDNLDNAFVVDASGYRLKIDNTNVMNVETEGSEYPVEIGIPYVESDGGEEFVFVQVSQSDLARTGNGRVLIGHHSDFRNSLTSLLFVPSDDQEDLMDLIPNPAFPEQMVTDRTFVYLGACIASGLAEPYSNFRGVIGVSGGADRLEQNIEIKLNFERYDSLMLPGAVVDRIYNVVEYYGGIATSRRRSSLIESCSVSLLSHLPTISITFNHENQDHPAFRFEVYPEDYIARLNENTCRIMVQEIPDNVVVLSLKQMRGLAVHWDFANDRIGFGDYLEL